MAYGGSGRFAEAIDPFLRALRLNPAFAEGYYRLGTIYSELEQHDEAAIAYQSAIRLDPDNVTCHCALAELFLEQNKPADAIVPAKEAVRLNPDLADAYLLLGNDEWSLRSHGSQRMLLTGPGRYSRQSTEY
jgi:tetratricopeptide (TPR) repeat protein